MRAALLTLIALLSLLFGGPPALAAPADVLIGDVQPELSDGADRKVELKLTNLTSDPLRVSVALVTPEANCALGPPNPGELPPSRQVTVSVAVPAPCTVADTGLKFTVTAGATQIGVTATKPAQSKPDWEPLWVYFYALVSLMVLAVLATIGLAIARKFALSYLDSAWSFKDSWAGNITVIGGLLTGVFGASGVMKALLGEDAESKIALAVVGAAISAAFVAAGPLVLLALKWKKQLTTAGLFIAAALTLTGAVGELWMVTAAAEALDLDGWERHAVPLRWLGILLLTWYAVTTLYRTVQDGLTKPEPAGDSDTIRAAKLITAAIATMSAADSAKFTESMQAIEDRYPDIGTSPGDDVLPISRRSGSL